MKITKMRHEFVELMPEIIEDGVLYVSIKFALVIHKCPCGCGGRVVTPIAPDEWKLTFDGETISLDPSVGNWSFDCQSHYFIKENKVKAAGKMSKDEIDYVRKMDMVNSKVHLWKKKAKEEAEKYSKEEKTKKKKYFWQRKK